MRRMSIRVLALSLAAWVGAAQLTCSSIAGLAGDDLDQVLNSVRLCPTAVVSLLSTGAHSGTNAAYTWTRPFAGMLKLFGRGKDAEGVRIQIVPGDTPLSSKPFSVRDVTFVSGGNTTYNQAPVQVKEGQVDLKDVVFTGFAGPIFNVTEGGTLKITNGTFMANRVPVGQALVNVAAGRFVCEGCTFRDGEGSLVHGTGADSSVGLMMSRVWNNTVAMGALMSLDNSVGGLQDVSIVNNTALEGSVLLATNEALLFLVHSLLRNNSGGDLKAHDSDIRVNHTLFTGSSAQNSGSVASLSGASSLKAHNVYVDQPVAPAMVFNDTSLIGLNGVCLTNPSVAKGAMARFVAKDSSDGSFGLNNTCAFPEATMGTSDLYFRNETSMLLSVDPAVDMAVRAMYITRTVAAGNGTCPSECNASFVAPAWDPTGLTDAPQPMTGAGLLLLNPFGTAVPSYPNLALALPIDFSLDDFTTTPFPLPTTPSEADAPQDGTSATEDASDASTTETADPGRHRRHTFHRLLSKRSDGLDTRRALASGPRVGGVGPWATSAAVVVPNDTQPILDMIALLTADEVNGEEIAAPAPWQAVIEQASSAQDPLAFTKLVNVRGADGLSRGMDEMAKAQGDLYSSTTVALKAFQSYLQTQNVLLFASSGDGEAANSTDTQANGTADKADNTTSSTQAPTSEPSLGACDANSTRLAMYVETARLGPNTSCLVNGTGSFVVTAIKGSMNASTVPLPQQGVAEPVSLNQVIDLGCTSMTEPVYLVLSDADAPASTSVCAAWEVRDWAEKMRSQLTATAAEPSFTRRMLVSTGSDSQANWTSVPYGTEGGGVSLLFVAIGDAGPFRPESIVGDLPLPFFPPQEGDDAHMPRDSVRLPPVSQDEKKNNVIYGIMAGILGILLLVVVPTVYYVSCVRRRPDDSTSSTDVSSGEARQQPGPAGKAQDQSKHAAKTESEEKGSGTAA